MRAVVLLVIVVLLSAGCGGGDGAADAGGADVTLGEEQHLAEVDVSLGDTIEVRLESNASTGYRWEPAQLPDVLAALGDRYEEPDTDLVGAAGTQVLTFEVVADGAGILRLEYVRPFDDPPVPDRVIEYVIRVDGAPWPPADPGAAPSTSSATAPVDVADLASTDPGPVEVRGFVVWEPDGARLCGLLLESFPPQCGGASVTITDPELLDLPLDEEQGVRWTAGVVVLRATYDGSALTLQP